MFGHTGRVGKEFEADITLDQGLELPGVVSKHIRVIGPVMVPQTGELLWQQRKTYT